MKIRSALVCDDVRIEDNGKHIIIGVYSNNVAVGSFPATVALTIWMQLLVDEAGLVDIEVRARDAANSKHLFSSFEGTLEIKKSSEALVMRTPQFMIHIDEPRVISFEIKEKGKRWTKITEIPILKRL